MGHKHTKAEILNGALDVAYEIGLSRLTYGQVANRLGISDRVVVYYFPSKDDLVSEVLILLGLRLQETLAPAFGAPAADYLGLLRTAWPILAQATVDPIFALFFEANGLAATGRDPYRVVLPQLVEAWISWAAGFLGGNSTDRRTEAETAIAVVDGLLLLRQVCGPDAAERVATKLGITG